MVTWTRSAYDLIITAPDMKPIEYVVDCLQRRIAASNVQCWTRESVERELGHDSSCGHAEVALELPVTLHGSYTGPR